MSFFDSFPQPPPPEPAPEPPRPAWMKPEFVVPGSVAADLVLVRTDEVAVTLGLLRAYTTGFEFTVDTRSRRRGQHHRIGAGPRRYLMQMQGTDTEDRLRVGLEFSDGRRAELGAPRPHPDQVTADTLVVHPCGGGGSDRSSHERYWVYPLPTPGPLSFIATWPAFGITEARIELEAEAVLSAAARAIVLWPEAPGRPLGEATMGVVTAGRVERGDDETGARPRT
ncbi:hypothetical protein KGA66_19235 [Actinocrinis puniceicyclus]|uniref:Uncharacterized protein n=1 Tax=Actinocrinis puniceicyclus TaxID=977794 RepID=A0A8J7WSI0_9ACTN|nr:hypothetical protein [Actinocrinis puniceicyclus]MBS2965192.1 hypothetical protein [Actinocrinis puniceicyclus]